MFTVTLLLAVLNLRVLLLNRRLIVLGPKQGAEI
jgi:hypothetical protein